LGIGHQNPEFVGGRDMNDNSRVKFWWGVSFLCNLVAVWFIQPLLAFFHMMGLVSSTPAALVELEVSLSSSSATMGSILCIIALLIGISAASKAASMAG